MLEQDSSISFRQITPPQTVHIRHTVLWPDAPISYVLLPEDERGWHYGAFASPMSSELSTARESSKGVEDISCEKGGEGEDEQLVAVISLFFEAYPTELDHHDDLRPTSPQGPQSTNTRIIRFRKFACDPRYQGRGIGSKLLDYSVEDVQRRDGNDNGKNEAILWCDARTSTLEWYEKRGFHSFGGRFHKGGVEYVRMRKEL